uniref:Alpha-2-macroglobulin receptor-associated protein-like n=1 Tax=Phallusia mammillata TaxID=59560 RepID=A0A6F9DJY7_9ASCI|nr:alpha-2-macroglobulin receptor-associated protein-like [Phallusia mammillata]
MLGLCCMTVLVCCILAQDNTKENVNKAFSENQFRSSKVKQVWEKANRMEIPSVLLSDLFVELKEHDRSLMELKQSKLDGNENYDSLNRDLDRSFRKLMMKYGIVRDEEQTNIMGGKEPQSKQKPVFQDVQLNKLWVQTTKGKDLTKSELEKLHLEFKSHEEKLFEYQRLEDSVGKIKAISENSVEKFEHADDLREKEASLKHLEEEIRSSYDRIMLVSQKTKEGDTVPFSDPRAMELWKLANDGNHTESELLSIKEELQQFETRADKHRHFKDELRNSAAKIDHHGGKRAAPTEKLNRHQKLQEKVQDLAYKVKKMFKGLQERFASRVVSHNEL